MSRLMYTEHDATRFCEVFLIEAEEQKPIRVERIEREGIEEYGGVVVYRGEDADGNDLCEMVFNDDGMIVRVFYP